MFGHARELAHEIHLECCITGFRKKFPAEMIIMEHIVETGDREVALHQQPNNRAQNGAAVQVERECRKVCREALGPTGRG